MNLLDLLQYYGLAFVFINVLALQAGLPVPAYPTLIVTGALAARGGYSLPALLGTAVAASLIADLSWYSLGPTCRRPCTAHAMQNLAVAGFVRAPDRGHLHAVGRAVADGREIHSGLRVGRDGDGRRVARPAVALHSVRRNRRGAMVGCRDCAGLHFRNAIDDVLTVLQELGKIGLVLIVLAFFAYLFWKWLQRKRFIRQLIMDRISVDEVRRLMDEGRLGMVIDVRSPMSQQVTGRIPGAVTVDPQNLKFDLIAVEPQSEVVVYCACPNEATAAKVAKALIQHGFKRVRPLHGGIDAWIEAGHAVEH
jgi:rhodanese-related sulfurtransferase